MPSLCEKQPITPRTGRFWLSRKLPKQGQLLRNRAPGTIASAGGVALRFMKAEGCEQGSMKILIKALCGCAIWRCQTPNPKISK